MISDAHRQAEFEQERMYQAARLREQKIEDHIERFCDNPEILNEIIGDYINEKNIGDTYDRIMQKIMTVPYYKLIREQGKEPVLAVIHHVRMLQDLTHTAVKDYAIKLIDKETG